MRTTAKPSSTGGSPGSGKGRHLLVLALTTALALLLTPALASAADPGHAVHHFKENLGHSLGSEPTFKQAEQMVVDQSTGDLLVIDSGEGLATPPTISRWKPNGEPAPFSKLEEQGKPNANVIDGKAGYADATPKGGVLYELGGATPNEFEIAVDNSGTATNGNIYATYGGLGKEVDIFNSNGEYKGRLTAAGATNFSTYVCGVAVDSSGAVYVGDPENGEIHKFVPSVHSPTNLADNEDNTANFTTVSEPCKLAAGAGPTAGYLFAASYSGELHKLNSSTGEVKSTVESGEHIGVSVDPGSGHVFAAKLFGTAVSEYDASGSSAVKFSSIAPGSEPFGAAVNGATGKLYVTRSGNTKIEVYEAPYTVKLIIAGTGSGEVSSTPLSGGYYEGIPPIQCHSPAPGSGTCKTALIEESISPGSELIGLKVHTTAGSEFAGWTTIKGNVGACTGTATTCAVSGSEGDVELTATFNVTAKPKFKLSATKSGTGTGEVTSSPPGITCGGDCEEEYEEGEVVTLSHSASAGSAFKEWTGACTGTGACTVTMSAAKSVNAVFAHAKQTLAVTKSITTGAGTIKAKPAGINCGATCSAAAAAYYKNTLVTLTEVPATGATFSGWGGDCASSGIGTTCTLTMSAAKAVTAGFSGAAKVIANPQTLTLSKAPGTGQGTVKSKPGGITCEAACTSTTASFAGAVTLPKPKPAALVTLTATGVAGSELTAWGGDCSASPCEVTMSGTKSVTAKFDVTALPKQTLAVTKSITTGAGTIKAKPAGINCGATCSAAAAAYYKNTLVTLTEVPATGATFSGWGGDCASSGIGTTCTLTMSAAKAVTAGFSGAAKVIANPQTLTLSKAPGTGQGTVKSKPGGITCEAACTSTTASFAGAVTLPKPKPAALVTLTATPALGSELTAWGGDCSASPCEVTMSGTKSVTAKFDE